jgi:hypothetical protein
MSARSRCRVMVDENFHYMDPESRWELGTFDTADEALAACRRMVDEDLREHHNPGMSVADLFAAYRALGDDPFIVPVDGAAMIEFSAWDYAEERCRAICGLALRE